MQLYHPTNSTAIVYAAQIIDVLDGVASAYNPLGWRALRLQGHNITLPTPEGWQAQHKPKPGDYLVQDTEGRAKIVPEALFLGAYHRASPADDSEHPAWPIRTHEEPVAPAAAAPMPSTVLDRVKSVRREVYQAPPPKVGGILAYAITYDRAPAEELEHDHVKLGGREPVAGDALVRDADGVERIIPRLMPPALVQPQLPKKVARAALEAMFRSVTHEIRPDGRTTVCEITFKNGFSVRGEESCSDIDDFSETLGQQYAYEKALGVAWGYAAFLLAEDRYRADKQAPAAATVDVDAMVNRFLGWKLPVDFYPDAGVSFSRTYAAQWGMPSGTNLFNAEQAKAMFEYCLKGGAA